MFYKYETHLHTLQASACGSTSASDYIKPYFEAGYSGIIVTDHFFGGNTAVPHNLEWKERVEQYCSGYELALETAIKMNEELGIVGTEKEFKVFFGIEQTFRGDDYLVYGLSKQYLLEHPEIEAMTHQQLFDAVNACGGLMIQAHPFRFRDYMRAMHLYPRQVHGVEVVNSGNLIEENELAKMYASYFDFPVTAGSDIHNVEKLISGDMGLSVTGMSFETPLKDIFDYARRIKNKEGKIIQ